MATRASLENASSEEALEELRPLFSKPRVQFVINMWEIEAKCETKARSRFRIYDFVGD